MVGRDMAHRYPDRTPDIGETLFEVRDWHVHHALHADREQIKGVNLHVRRGEGRSLLSEPAGNVTSRRRTWLPAHLEPHRALHRGFHAGIAANAP